MQLAEHAGACATQPCPSAASGLASTFAEAPDAGPVEQPGDATGNTTQGKYRHEWHSMCQRLFGAQLL
jgi:hypothetical protein